MPLSRRAALMVLLAIGAAIAYVNPIHSQSGASPRSYRQVETWPQLPPEIQAKLKTCRGEECSGQVHFLIPGDNGSVWMLTRFDPPLLKIDASSGKLLKSFGDGTFVSTHGFCMDRDGNLWAGDYGVRPASAATGAKGLQVHKFTQDGKLLLSLGKAGEAGVGPDRFVGPTACAIAPNGDVLIADGHIPRNAITEGDRIMRFSKDGKFLTEYGKTGSGPGEFKGIHALAFDSRGYLFVADRTNNRVQVLDQQMKFVTEYKQFGRPSGLTIVNGNTLVVSDWESGGPLIYSDTPGGSATAAGSGQLRNATFMQGRPKPTTFGTGTNVVRIGSTLDGTITTSFETTQVEGVGTDQAGNIYVGPWKYVPR